MIKAISFRQVNTNVADIRTYLLVGAFVAGNIILPRLFHFIPDGGKIFLPIYFFTLIAGYKYGWKAGLMTAILSPVINSLFFGMPALAALPVLLVKSSLLALAAAGAAKYWGKISILIIAGVVMAYQVVGGVAEWAITGSFQAAMQDFTLGFPGMLLQILAGWLALRWLAEK